MTNTIPPVAPPAGAPALLLLDAAGKVTSANAAAAVLWQTATSSLAGRSLVSLLKFEVVPGESDWESAQWDAVLGSALHRPLLVDLAVVHGPAQPVSLQLEPVSAGGPAVWFAYLQDTAASSSPSLAGGDYGLPLVIARGNVGFFDLNFRLNTARYSLGWKLLLGYTDAELPDTYDSWLGLLHAEDTAAAPDKTGRRLSPGTHPFSAEYRMRHRAGHYVWIECAGIKVVSEAGALERVCGLHLDISERKESEEISLLQEERLQNLADDGGLAAFDLDFSENRHWFSSSWHRLLGTRPQGDTPDSPARLLGALVTEGGTDGLEAFFNAAGDSAGPGQRTARLKAADGREIPVFVGFHRRLSRVRTLQRVTGFVMPLANLGGAGGNASLADILPVLAEAVILTDRQGNVEFFSGKAGQLTAIKAGQAKGQPLPAVFKLVDARSGQPADSALDTVLADPAPGRLQSDHALQLPDGSLLPIVWTALQNSNPDGTLRSISVAFRDPKEMSLTPEELVRANRFEALGLLAGGIAHDFNNLLTTILGGVSHAKDSHDYSRMEDAEQACLAAKDLTRELLAFSRGSAGAARHYVETASLLQSAVRIAAAGSPAVVTVEAGPDSGGIVVDKGQIIQVFQNLIINSLQALANPYAGYVTLRAGCVDLAAGNDCQLAPGRYVRIAVEDNGVGIPSELLGRIFDRFYTTKKQGTGLGLSTVLSIVRRHAGHIRVDSEVGTGTTFTVHLPYAEKPAEVETRSAPTLRFGTGRILLMDDDPKICELTGGMLASLDYTHDVARTAEEAIQLYRRYLNVDRPYDAVILDLTMIGGMGGEECFRRLREIDPKVRAILSSGYDNDDIARQYLEMGFAGYLTKPYRVVELGRVIKRVLGR